ncbi:hypothetical protein EON63_15970 [archaeon]|nr:MAG: hypothetical protein EON63_15970 [archaeon]
MLDLLLYSVWLLDHENPSICIMDDMHGNTSMEMDMDQGDSSEYDSDMDRRGGYTSKKKVEKTRWTEEEVWRLTYSHHTPCTCILTFNQHLTCANSCIQDAKLRQAVAALQGKNWKLVANFLPGKTEVQCLHRLAPIPYTIHHAPYTICYTPYTIHHIPCTIHHQVDEGPEPNPDKGSVDAPRGRESA